ncbi:hypothetical protein [Virgibacillus sp. JSM 102003]
MIKQVVFIIGGKMMGKFELSNNGYLSDKFKKVEYIVIPSDVANEE